MAESIKKITPKKILVWAMLALLVALIVVLTAVPLVFDAEHLDFQKWLTNTFISLGIMISSIILGELVGEDKQKDRPNGLYQTALRTFNETLKRLTDEGDRIIVYFSQFYVWFKARELKNKKEAYLVDNGIEQLLSKLIVTYIERDDLESMRKQVVIKKDPKNGNEIKFRRIHDDEYDVIKDIFSTKFVIDAPEYTYYMSAFGDSTSVSTLEQAKLIERKERSNKTFNRVFKITLSVFISLIWGMATIDEAVNGGIQEASVNMAVRLLSLFGGLLGGYMTSVVAIKLASQKLENKNQVLTFYQTFYDKKEFVPKTYEQLVEDELKEEKERISQ